MSRKLIFVSLIFFSTFAFADAGDGEYLGYTLGEKYEAPRGAVGQDHVMGAKIYVAHAGQHPHHVDSVSVYVSPKSSIIGSIFGEWYFAGIRSANSFADRYLSSLENKYGHWKRRGRSLTYGDYQLWVYIEEKPPVVDNWPSRKNTRVAIGLIYAPDTLGRGEWMALVTEEANNLKLTARQ